MALDLNKPTYVGVSETFRPQKEKGFPVTHQEFIKGGLQTFDDMAQANAFSMKKRSKWMMANINNLLHVISEDLSSWNPCEIGYLSFNPMTINQRYNVIYPFNFKIASTTSHEVTIVDNLVDGQSNVVQHIILSGNADSVITYEILKWY